MQTVTTTLKYSTPLLLWPGREFTRVKLLQSKHSPRNLVKAYLQWLIFRNTITLDIFNKPIYKYSGEGGGTPLQCSCLENPMDGGAWWAAVPGVSKSRTRLSNFTFMFHFHALEKEMATHSSVLAWRIPGTGETGGLPSMGSHRIGHN